jgi:AcrR family transcriptional regulator
MRSPKSPSTSAGDATRPYRMRRRAEHVDETRQRIVEATVRLHTTIGPARTSIASVAEEAGVTRVTVYRHFPALDALFEACSGHWAAVNPGPDLASLLAADDPEVRVRGALRAHYRWFGVHGRELYPIYRDMASMPRSTQDAMAAATASLADGLVGGLPGAGAGGAESRAGRARAVAGHVASFWTWHSLSIEQALGDDAAAEVAADMLLGALR